MESSSRQSDILQKLQQIRRELAKKERKLQKLKRLSAHKRSLQSGDSSSVDPEETRSSIDTDVSSPLHPIETTLSQKEICHSKLLRAVQSEDESLIARARESEAQVCSALPSVQSDRTEGRKSSSPVLTVKLTGASAGRRALAPAAFSTHVYPVSGESPSTENYSTQPQIIAPLSLAPARLPVGAGSSLTEASTSDVSEDTTALNLSERFSSASSSSISQDQLGRCGELVEVALKQGLTDDGEDDHLSWANFVEGGDCEHKNEVAVHAALCDGLENESKFCAKNSSPLLTVSGEESSTYNADNLESTQKDMFENSETCWASQDTDFSARSQDSRSVIQLDRTHSTESIVPSCQTTEVSEFGSPKSWSPARKRRRTVCEQMTTGDYANTKDYNFRKRRFSCSSPSLERRRTGKEAKTVLSAFHKLVKQALELPVSMFQLHFEKLGLLQCLRAKDLSGQQAIDKNSESTANNSELLDGCSDKTRASLSVEPEMSTGGNTFPKVEKLQSSTSLYPPGIATLPLKSTNTEAQSSTPFSETRATRRSHRQRRQCSLPSATPLANDTVQYSITATTVPAVQQHNGTGAARLTTSTCALMADHTKSGQTTVAPSESSCVVHMLPKMGLSSATQLQDVTDVDCAASASPIKGCCEVQGLLLPSSGVRKVGHLCQLVKCRNSMSVHEVSGRKAPIAASSCEVSALEGQKEEVPSHTISTRRECVSNNPLRTLMIETPKAPGDAKSVSNGTNGMSAHFPSAAYSHSGHSSERSIRIHAGQLSSFQSNIDGQSLENGEVGRASIADKEVAMCSPAHSTLFTQSEESDGTGGDMTDLVTDIVEHLGSQEGSTVSRTAVDQHGGYVTILSDSATPDDLDIVEVPCILAPTPRAPLSLPLSCGQDNILTEAHSSESELGSEGASCLGDSTDLLSSLRDRCKAQDNSSRDDAGSASRPSSHLMVGGTREAGLPGDGKFPSSADTASSAAAEEQVRKGTGTDMCQSANSEVAQLLDAQDLEGMFDEWSEECTLDNAARPATVGNAVDSGTVTVGSCGISNSSHSSTKEAAQSILAEQHAAAIHLESSSQGGCVCKQEAGAECGSPNPWKNQGQTGLDPRKLECGSTHSLARSDTEDERNSPPVDQCSSPSASLEALSGTSKFFDEVCGRRDMERHAKERQLNSSPAVYHGGKCIGSLCNKDCDGLEQNCVDAVDHQESCDAGAWHRGSLLGAQSPLFLFCALKCEQEQPVTATYLVRAEPLPFLVSVQASAVSVWHLEHNAWRHSLAVGNLRFPLEGGEHCLLCCGEWSVLAYLSPLAPMHVPCIQWRTDNGGGGVQLMLTLGSLRERRRSLYHMAKLGREGWFVTALRTARGTTLLRVHRLRYVRGELCDETEPVGCTSNLLDSLIGVEGNPNALLGNSANVFYVWDCESRLLVKKINHEPDIFADLQHISWCCSDRGLLFVLMRSSDDVTSTLVAMNPFSCKAEAVSSSSWKMAAQARASDSRPCRVHVEGRYAACVGPGYGIRIWNLFSGNTVANMWYHSSTSVAMTDVSGTTFVAVGLADGRVLVFTS